MKKQLLFLVATITLLAVYGVETIVAESVAHSGKPVVIEVNYPLNTITSNADRERTLDQKATKQKVKLFGSMVDVDLGPVKLNTAGNVVIKEGRLTTTNIGLSEGTVVFDMASFKFAKEKGTGLFDVTNHPNSTMVFTNFSGSTADGNLTIQGTGKEVDVQVVTI